MKTTTYKLLYVLYWTAIFIVSISMLVYGIAKSIQFQNFASGAATNLSPGIN